MLFVERSRSVARVRVFLLASLLVSFLLPSNRTKSEFIHRPVVASGAGFIQPGYCLLIGIIGSVSVYWWLQLKKYFLHIDDTLDTFSCHGVGGIVGCFCVGLFSQKDVNTNGYDGAFYGNPLQMWRQLAGILTVSSIIETFLYLSTMLLYVDNRFCCGVYDWHSSPDAVDLWYSF